MQIIILNYDIKKYTGHNYSKHVANSRYVGWIRQTLIKKDVYREIGPMDIWIANWVSIGLESYCYETNRDKIVHKIKKLTLNYKTSKNINSDSMNKFIKSLAEPL